MGHIYRVGAYVKLAKLWERSRARTIEYHKAYYKRKYENNAIMELAGIYIDITGNKHIYQRPEMVRLLSDCKTGKVDCIASQTGGYLAANLEEFCYLYSYISEFNNEIAFVTEDDQYQINTIENPEKQKEELTRMAKNYTEATLKEYELWKENVEHAIAKM